MYYYAYVISVSSHQSLISDLFDYNVYHGHKLRDGLTVKLPNLVIVTISQHGNFNQLSYINPF